MSRQDMFLPIPEYLSELEEIECTIEWHIENNGIGSYEYWGFCGYDAGIDYSEIDSITPIFTTEDEPTQKSIEKYIDEHYALLCEIAEEKLEELKDDYDGDY